MKSKKIKKNSRKEVEEVENKICIWLKIFYKGDKKKDDSRRRATLAKLRRGAGKNIADAPETWEFIYFGYGKDGDPRPRYTIRSEYAIFTALTLFALHAQGQTEEETSPHDGHTSFGKALQELKYDKEKKSEGASNGITTHFNSLVTARKPEEISQHARSLIQLLKQGEKRFNYAEFAGDLYDFVSDKDYYRNRVARKWGRDYWWHDIKNDDKNNDKKGEKND